MNLIFLHFISPSVLVCAAQDYTNLPGNEINPTSDYNNPNSPNYDPGNSRYDNPYDPARKNRLDANRGQRDPNQYDPTNYDPMRNQYDPSRSQFDPTRSQYDPTRSQYDPTRSQYDPTKNQYDPTLNQYDQIRNKYDPTLNKYDPTVYDPTDNNRYNPNRNDRYNPESTPKPVYDSGRNIGSGSFRPPSEFDNLIINEATYFIVASKMVRPGQIYKISANILRARLQMTIRASISCNGVELTDVTARVKEEEVPEVLNMRMYRPMV